MSIGEAKSKSEMTDTEHYTIINSYGFALFVEKATGFYDEDPFSMLCRLKSGRHANYELDLARITASRLTLPRKTPSNY